MICINSILYFDILAPPPTTTQNRLKQSNKFSCVGKASGFYPNPYSCDSYYICVSQISSKVHCAIGLLYNIKTKFCDWPQNVQCVNLPLFVRTGDFVFAWEFPNINIFVCVLVFTWLIVGIFVLADVFAWVLNLTGAFVNTNSLVGPCIINGLFVVCTPWCTVDDNKQKC
jgi:hypothetical protein